MVPVLMYNMPHRNFFSSFLWGYSCNAQSHKESLAAHIKTEGPHNHHGLHQLVPQNIPHTLDEQYILSPKVGSEITSLGPDQWQMLFSGSTAEQFDGEPKQACLHTERASHSSPVISFDIDSFLGFVDSPAAAVHGIRFYSAPQYHQNI